MYKEGKIMTTGATLLGRGMRRILLTTLGGILVGSLLCGGTATTAAGMPAGGPIQLFVTPNDSGGGPIVITGAIGDSGPTQSINQNGTPNPNGNFEKIMLKKGTFEVDSTALNAAMNKVQPTMNAKTCSAYFSAGGSVTLLKGTGLYTGISGTVKVTGTFAFILPTVTSGAKKGQCNMGNNVAPIAEYGSIIGTGTVKFS